MKIFVLGNSHIAALRDGWSLVRGLHPGVDLCFFGAVGLGSQEIKVDGSRLQPVDPTSRDMFRITSGGSDYLDVADFDGGILCGMGFGHQLALTLYHRYRVFGHQDWSNPKLRLVSRPCFVEIAYSRLMRSGLVKTLRSIQSTRFKNLIVQSQPGLGEQIINWLELTRNAAADADPVTMGIIERQAEQFKLLSSCPKEDWQSIANIMQQLAHRATDTEGIPFLLPPEASVVNHILTRRDYNIRAGSFSDPERNCPDIDIVHMNNAYGALVLERLLERAQAGTGDSA